MQVNDKLELVEFIDLRSTINIRRTANHRRASKAKIIALDYFLKPRIYWKHTLSRVSPEASNCIPAWWK